MINIASLYSYSSFNSMKKIIDRTSEIEFSKTISEHKISVENKAVNHQNVNNSVGAVGS